MVSFLDNLENNLKALESREEGGVDNHRRREQERGYSLAIAPWVERLKNGPFTQKLMRQATVAGHQRRTKVSLIWIGEMLRLEARNHRLELRPTTRGVMAVFLKGGAETSTEPVDLEGDPQPLVGRWMAILDEQKRADEAEARAAALELEGE